MKFACRAKFVFPQTPKKNGKVKICAGIELRQTSHKTTEKFSDAVEFSVDAKCLFYNHSAVAVGLKLAEKTGMGVLN